MSTARIATTTATTATVDAATITSHFFPLRGLEKPQAQDAETGKLGGSSRTSSRASASGGADTAPRAG
jgi:hypothetical protein